MAKILHEVARAAIDADIERFPCGVDYKLWFSFPALTVEDIAAISNDREPEILNPKRIDEFPLPTPHPLLAKNRQALMGMSAIAIEFKKRRDFLLRSCRHGDLRAMSVGDTYEVRWTDFAAWLDRQGRKGPWDLLPDEFEQRLKKFGADEHADKEEAALAGAGNADTRKENGLSSSGVSEGEAEAWDTEKEGATARAVATEAATASFASASTNMPADGAVDAPLNLEKLCQDYLIGEMRKCLDPAPKVKDAYWTDCKRLFRGIGKREFKRAWKSAIKVTESAWGKAGIRPKLK